MTCNRRTAAKAILGGLTACGFPAFARAGRLEAAVAGAAVETLKTQVCVIGAGSGGTGAALAAARAGAKVVLLERESVLGGTATGALVCVWRPVMGSNGIPRDLYQAMKKDPLGVAENNYEASTTGPRLINGKPVVGASIPFEPRVMDYSVRTLLDATGCCQTLLATTFFAARMENNAIKAVEAWFAGKRLVIEADVFIDCTADGDVCVDAGCEYHMGEDPKSRYNEPHAPEKAQMILNGLTLCYRIADTGVEQKPYLPKEVEAGKCNIGACFDRLPNGDHVVNVVPMLPGNAILEFEYSRLMRDAHRLVLDHFFQVQNLPADSVWTSAGEGKGLKTWAICGIAPRIGVRETRRIVTDYVLCENDLDAGVAKQAHEDVIAIADHSVDLHAPGVKSHPVEGPFGVPYRCLLPKNAKNLMVASRAAGFSHIAAASCRLQRTLITLGQAAGTAAAMGVMHGASPREIDVTELQAKLVKQGVAIGV